MSPVKLTTEVSTGLLRFAIAVIAAVCKAVSVSVGAKALAVTRISSIVAEGLFASTLLITLLARSVVV